MRQESKYAQAIVISDHHHALFRQRIAVIHGDGSRASGETAAVSPDDYGATFAGRFCSGPDVDVEAILAGRRRRSSSRAALLLHTHGAKRIGFPHAFPVRGGTRLTPA